MIKVYRLFYDDYEESTVIICSTRKKAEEALDWLVSQYDGKWYKREDFSIDEWTLDEIDQGSSYFE